MKTQFDHNTRVVSLANLEAMCERISGMCHRFEVVKVSRSRVHVEYSNPNEYGTEHPMTAVYPCYPTGWEADNPSVVLDLLRVIGDSWNGEGWRAFNPLHDCPSLYRSGPDADDWASHREIAARPGYRPMDRDTCTVCDLDAS